MDKVSMKMKGKAGFGLLKAIPNPAMEKKLLLQKIDEALKSASGENVEVAYVKWGNPSMRKPESNDKRHFFSKIDIGKTSVVTMRIGTVTFTIPNDRNHLLAFRKNVSAKFPSSVKTGIDPSRPTFHSVLPTGKRIILEDVEYYNRFHPRKQGLIEGCALLSGERRNMYSQGWFMNSYYAVKTERPKLPLIADAPDVVRLIPKDKDLEPATLLGEFNGSECALVHAVSESGKSVILNAKYVDSVLTLYPNAKGYITGEKSTFAFKDKGEIIGIIIPMNLPGCLAPFAGRIEEIRKEKGFVKRQT